MAIRMAFSFILKIYTLFLCSYVVHSLEDSKQNIRSNASPVRKRIDDHGGITDGATNDVESGRKYLESLWDTVEKNHDRKLERGRMRYLESMMSMLHMSMSLPTEAPAKPPSNSPPDLPNEPTQVPVATKNPTPETDPAGPLISPSPTVQPVRGPTLPTREPIPTKAPIPAPSPGKPIEVPTTPTLPPIQETSPPTRTCTETEKENLLLETLSQTTDKSKLLNTDTPQGMAYAFLLDERPSFVCGPTLMQRYSLSTFYFATGGASWTKRDGWLGNTQECKWYGVSCDDNLFLTNLNLAVNNLSGSIPDEISVLSSLRDIDLFFNSITGSLPDGLVGLESLTSLDFQQNLLTGPAFPSSVTTLTRLESYRVGNNELSGEIPTQIGSLRNLVELWAGDNAISGTIPSDIGDLRNLKTIFLNNNALKGKLPSEIGLIPMEGLVMNNNNFLGTIPSQLFNVASLDTIRLDSNFFEGSLPIAIGQLTDLESLRIESNDLTGEIPKSIGFMTSLVNLRLNNNRWSGTIPDVFQNYKQLDFFDISENAQMEGSIPKTIFSIPTLRLAYMSKCGLNGTIPVQYAEPPDLRDLYLDGNEISGTIPPIKPGQLEKLNEFLLQGNEIVGTMPESICALRLDFILDDLWTDCSGQSPEIECDFPECCNRCFELDTTTTQRKNERKM